MEALLNRRIDVESYLVGSTVFSVFMFIRIAHVGIDIFLGYLVIVVNTLLLLAMDRLLIHRNHAIIIGVLATISIIASAHSDTPTMSILAQLIGICVFSIYYLSVLTKLGLPSSRWLELYAPIAVLIALYGIIQYVLFHTVLAGYGDPRLKSIYEEPSFFIFLTLPALGFYANEWVRARRYGQELLILLIAYALADSSLGYLGILLVAYFAFLPRLSFVRLLGFGVLACISLVALFFASANFRLRVVDTAVGIATSNLSGVNASTFAILTNGYVTIQAFLAHPFLGVGLGGYQFAYTRYISGLSGLDPDLISLNMYDASSLFLRTTAELGIFGIGCLLAFFLICSRVRGEQYVEIRNVLLPYLIVRMSRYGAYFSVEFYFFVAIYILNYLHSRALYKTRTAPPPAANLGQAHS